MNEQVLNNFLAEMQSSSSLVNQLFSNQRDKQKRAILMKQMKLTNTISELVLQLKDIQKQYDETKEK